MKLKKQLETLPDEALIKVGAKNGSGWFYVGTVEELKRYMDVYNDTVYNRWKYIVKNATERLERAVDNTPTWAMYIRGTAKTMGIDTADFSFESYLKSCRRYESKLMKMRTLKQKYERIRDSYIHLEKREVVSCEKSDPVVDATFNIIIDGSETGVVWTSDEIKERGLQLK